MRFQVKTWAEEMALLRSRRQNDELREYLRPLVLDIMEKIEPESITDEQKVEQILGQVDVAAERFLLHERQHAGYKFSTYFIWYVKEFLGDNDPEE